MMMSRLVSRGRAPRRGVPAAYLCLALGGFLAVPPALAQLPPDGFWVVQGRGIPGMRCADWMVRLAVEQGRLTGSVGLSQGNVLIQNLVLRPDGSFSGDTAAGHVNARAVRAYRVRGQFSGDVVGVTLSNEICPDRTGSARRQWVGY
jgi:hypothetical protein